MNRTQSSSALLVLIAFCFHTERTNLFNNRRTVHCRFEELKRLSKHIYQKHTPRPARAHELYPVHTWLHHSEQESSTIPSIPCIPLKTLLQVSAKLQQHITNRERIDATHTPHIQYNNKLQVTHPKNMYIQTITYIPMHKCSCLYAVNLHTNLKEPHIQE